MPAELNLTFPPFSLNTRTAKQCAKMIKPFLHGQDFLNDVGVSLANHDALSVWWLGQSGFLVQWAGKHLLLDPYLSDSLTLKYANTDKPHVRMSERVIDPERLTFINVVTSSHNHTD